MSQDLSELWIPGAAQDELLVQAACEVGEAILFRQLLQDYDPDLDLIRAKENATSPGLKPGYWYIVRRPNLNVGRAWGLWEISEPNGDYCMPREEHFDRLREKDAWARPGLYHEYRKRQEEKVRQGEKRDAELHREFREKLNERLKFNHSRAVMVPKKMEAAAIQADAALDSARIAVAAEAGRPDAELEAVAREAALNAAPVLPDLVPTVGEAVPELERAPGPNREQRRKMRNKALTKPRSRPLR